MIRRSRDSILCSDWSIWWTHPHHVIALFSKSIFITIFVWDLIVNIFTGYSPPKCSLQ